MTTETPSLPANHLQSAAGVTKPIIFFDDVCVMCNGFVNLLLRVDRRQQFLFAPLRGETAGKLLPPLADDPDKWSMVYVDESGIHDESDASLEVYRRLGGLWWVLSLAQVRPAHDSQSGVPVHCQEPLSLVWQARCMSPTHRTRARTVPAVSRSLVF